MPRKMWRKRFDQDCKQISPSQNPTDPKTRYIDVKETRETKYTQGSGPAYRQSRYRHCHDSKDRQYEDDPLIIKPEGGTDPDSQTICYPQNIKRATIKAGSGPHFQATRLRYCNLQDGQDPREIREQELALIGADPNQDPADAPKIRVERITKATLQSGTGPAFQKKRLARLCNDEEQLTNNDNTEDLEPNTAPGY